MDYNRLFPLLTICLVAIVAIVAISTRMVPSTDEGAVATADENLAGQAFTGWRPPEGATAKCEECEFGAFRCVDRNVTGVGIGQGGCTISPCSVEDINTITYPDSKIEMCGRNVRTSSGIFLSSRFGIAPPVCTNMYSPRGVICPGNYTCAADPHECYNEQTGDLLVYSVLERKLVPPERYLEDAGEALPSCDPSSYGQTVCVAGVDYDGNLVDNALVKRCMGNTNRTTTYRSDGSRAGYHTNADPLSAVGDVWDVGLCGKSATGWRTCSDAVPTECSGGSVTGGSGSQDGNSAGGSGSGQSGAFAYTLLEREALDGIHGQYIGSSRTGQTCVGGCKPPITKSCFFGDHYCFTYDGWIEIDGDRLNTAQAPGSAVSTSGSQGTNQLPPVDALATTDPRSLAEILKGWITGVKSGSGNRAPPGGTPTNPNAGGSFGCDWSTLVNQCEPNPTPDTRLEVFENTKDCHDAGNKVTFTLLVRGIEKPNQEAPKEERFNKKNGATITLYHYTRSCQSEGGKTQVQHDDQIYSCPDLAQCTCSLQGDIQGAGCAA